MAQLLQGASQPLSRRSFLKLSAAAAGSAAALAALQNVMGSAQAAPHPQGEIQTGAEEKIVASTCALCPAGCGVLVRVADGRVVKLRATPCTR